MAGDVCPEGLLENAGTARCGAESNLGNRLCKTEIAV